MFSCTFCTKTFECGRNLNNHILSHTKEKPHKCLRCAAAFAFEGNLKTHIISVHDGVKVIKKRNTQCPLCSYKCYSKTYLERHLRKHSAEQPFSCSVPNCGFKTKYEKSVEQHVRNIHSAEHPFQCPSDGCTYKTKVKRSLERHLETHSRLKICKVPGCTYKGSGTLKAHKCTSEEKPWKCSFCDFRSKLKYNLVQHETTHKNLKRFRCQAPSCGFASSMKETVDRHFDRKHRPKAVRCTVLRCNFRCGSLAVLKRHLKEHELPVLRCPGNNCNFRSRVKCSLRRHISRLHPNLQSSSGVDLQNFDLKVAETADAMDTLHCRFSDCGYQTKLPRHYDRHIATHEEEKKRKHVCSFCFSRFSDLCVLQSHVQRHIGEKPYRCCLCQYAAVSTADLKAHARRLHHIHGISRVKEDKLRNCRRCNERFWSYSELVLHSMSHLRAVVVLKQIKLQIV